MFSCELFRISNNLSVYIQLALKKAAKTHDFVQQEPLRTLSFCCYWEWQDGHFFYSWKCLFGGILVCEQSYRDAKSLQVSAG